MTLNWLDGFTLHSCCTKPAYRRPALGARWLPALLLLAWPALAAEYTARWIGPGIGDWTNAANWDTPNFPNNTEDDVYDVVLEGNAVAGLITLNQPVSIRNLSFNVGRVVEITAGAQLIVEGDATWALARFDGPGGVIIRGNAQMTRVILGGSHLALHGETSLVGGRLDIYRASVTNAPESFFEITDATLYSSSRGRFENAGTFRIRNGYVLLSGIRFHNLATFEVIDSYLGVYGAPLIDGFVQTSGAFRLIEQTNAVEIEIVGYYMFSIDGGTLSGSGESYGGFVTNNGILSPGGDQGGQLLFEELRLGPNAVTRIQVGPSTNASVPFDRIDGNVIALDGQLELRVAGTIQPEDSFTVIRGSSLTGTFRNVASGQRLATADGAGSFLVRYGGGTNAVILSDFASRHFYVNDPLRPFAEIELTPTQPVEFWNGATLTIENSVDSDRLWIAETNGVAVLDGVLSYQGVVIGTIVGLEPGTPMPGGQVTFNSNATLNGIVQALRNLTFGWSSSESSFEEFLRENLLHEEPLRTFTVSVLQPSGEAIEITSIVEFNRVGGIYVQPDCVRFPYEDPGQLTFERTTVYSRAIDLAGRLDEPCNAVWQVEGDNFSLVDLFDLQSDPPTGQGVSVGPITNQRTIGLLHATFGGYRATAGLLVYRISDCAFRVLFRPSCGSISQVQAASHSPEISLSSFHALEALMNQNAEGRRWANLYWQHSSEVSHMMATHPGLIAQMLGVVSDFQPLVARLLGGTGQNFQITQEMINRLNGVWDQLIPLAGPVLRQALEVERANFNGFQDFVGKDFNQWAEMLGIVVPESPFIHLSNPRSDADAFRVEANYVEGLSYSLWRTPELSNSGWQPVSDARIELDGYTITLTDSNRPPGRAFYQIRAAPESP